MYTQVFEYEYDYHTQKMMGIEYGNGYGYLPIPILNTHHFLGTIVWLYPTQPSTTSSYYRTTQKGRSPSNQRRGPLGEENINLEEIALLQLGLIDITAIAAYDEYINTQTATVPLPLVRDPFWSEFNEWMRNNPNEYDEWLHTVVEL